MKLIVGLGNPGKEYAKTRHNSGFMAMDKLAERCGVSLTTSKWNALIAKTVINGEQVILMKPLTFMNLSGQAVAQAVHFYHIEPEDILVMHDDMDLTTGSVRIRAKGSSGGQKGMKSIQQSLGTNDIARIRIGVGHSRHGDHAIVPDWVLSPIPKAQQELFETALNSAADAAYSWVSDSIDDVMNRYTIRVRESEE